MARKLATSTSFLGCKLDDENSYTVALMRIFILLAFVGLAACAEQSVPRREYTNITGYDCYNNAIGDLDAEMASIKR